MKSNYDFFKNIFVLEDGTRVKLSVIDMINIKKFYTAASTAEYVYENPEQYGNMTPGEAYKIGCIAREIMDNSDGDIPEWMAIEQAVNQADTERRCAYV